MCIRDSAHAVVDVVTNAIVVRVCRARPTTDAEGVQLVSVSITVASRDVGTATRIDLSRYVADTTVVEGANTVVDVVANAITVGICRAVSTEDTEGIQLVSVTVAVSVGNVGAPTFVNRTGSIANVTSVKGSNAVVHIVANAVTVCIYRTVSTTFTDHVVKQTRHRRGVSVVACTHVRACLLYTSPSPRD